MRVVVTRIAWDGAVHRRMVDAARRGDGRQWVDLAARALTVLPPCRPVPRSPVYHVRVDDVVLEAAEHDLTAALLDLITAVLALGEDRLAGSGAAAGPGPFAQTGRRVNVIGRLRGETGCLPGVLGSAGPASRRTGCCRAPPLSPSPRIDPRLSEPPPSLSRERNGARRFLPGLERAGAVLPEPADRW